MPETPSAVRFKRVRAGVYATLDEQHFIIRTDAWEGPKGGTLFRWEHARPDTHGHGLVIDGNVFCTTLREAKRQVAHLIRTDEESSP